MSSVTLRNLHHIITADWINNLKIQLLREIQVMLSVIFYFLHTMSHQFLGNWDNKQYFVSYIKQVAKSLVLAQPTVFCVFNKSILWYKSLTYNYEIINMKKKS